MSVRHYGHGKSAWLSRGRIPRFTVKDAEWEATVEDLATKAALIVGGLLFNETGNREGEATAAMWAGMTYAKGAHAGKAVMMLLIALQRSVETGAENDINAILREMAPLISKASRKTREHRGVRRAAELIEQLGFDRLKDP
jgi:hypothetical protein